MELEQLHLRTVELLAAKAADYGLPPDTGECSENDQNSVLCGDTVVASAMAEALKEARSRELPLLEREEAPEVVALRANMQRLRALKDRMGTINTTLSDLRTAYSGVTDRTSSLHDACDRALAHQTALSAGAEQIAANLHYFKQADVILKKLSNTNKMSVTGQTFTSILASIDECLGFLRAHPEYSEAATYLAKFEQCLSRAMTWIRVGVCADLEASLTDVRDRQSQLQVDYAKVGRGGADDDTFALLYGVFAARANSVRSALSVAEQRFSKVPEFEAMLAECQQAYFQTREQLLQPIIQATLQHLVSVHGDSGCALTRSGCSFLLRVCDDEFRLYRQFFGDSEADAEPQTPRLKRGQMSPTPSMMSQATQRVPPTTEPHLFEEFTEALCRLLYDVLRPLVIHNPHLETLAELCAILKVEMIEERCGLMASVMESSIFDPRAGFVRVMGELVGDVQERIVHRAQIYAETDILGYRPAAGDLAYPAKLQMIRDIEKGKANSPPDMNEPKPATESSESVKDADSTEPSTVQNDLTPSPTPSAAPTTISAVDLHCLWYPTVRRTVMCLAKLFRCLDMGVFQSLARDLLSKCVESLLSAAEAIATQKGSKKQLDADLFVVKHLLILREQTTPYRQAATRADATLHSRDISIDFSRMRSSLMDDHGRWFELSSNNAFLELLFSVPIHLSEEAGDSRRVLDAALRARCALLIDTSSNAVLGPFGQLVNTAEDESLKEGFDVKQHSELSAKKVGDVAKNAFKALSTTWPEIRAAYALYLGVAETETILLAPVRKRIAESFARAVSFANRAYDEESKCIAALPSTQHVYLLLNKN